MEQFTRKYLKRVSGSVSEKEMSKAGIKEAVRRLPEAWRNNPCHYKAIMPTRFKGHDGPIGLCCLRCEVEYCNHRGSEDKVYEQEDFALVRSRKQIVGAG